MPGLRWRELLFSNLSGSLNGKRLPAYPAPKYIPIVIYETSLSAHLLSMAETLLYVDDNDLRLEVMTTRLRLLGYRVLSAGNGAEALTLFASNHIDLAVVDYYMPGMTGDMVAIEMKDQKPKVPVIIFSGVFTLSEMVIALVDGFVSTSDDPDSLLNKISEILAPRRKARAG